MTYTETLAALHLLLHERGVVHFQPCELAFMGAHHYDSYPINELVPEELMPNLADVAKHADALRCRCGFPLKVISAYRSEAYNKAVGGAPRSLHKQARALDLAPVAPSRIGDLKNNALQMHQDHDLPGGVGYYNSFVHIDTGRHRSW